MNPDVKKLWLEALRSGEYEQGVGRLMKFDPDGNTNYCCLGVLCDIAVQNNVTSAPDYSDEDGCMVFDREMDFLPPSIADWAGIDQDPEVDNPFEEFDSRTKIAQLNDSYGWSFSDLANIIEDQF